VTTKRTKRPNIVADKRQLAALATLLGLMQTASKLSRELDDLAGGIGGSLEDIVKAAGIPFFDVHDTYRDSLDRKAPKRPSKKRKPSRP
jgi:hypothetical protein